MAVVIETTLGDITVDLYLDQRPVTCLNFLKLCKMKYYNFNLFHSIRSGFIAQTGDPTGEGSGGQSVFGLLEGPDKRFFSGEKRPKIRHHDVGLLSMVGTGDMMIGSQFFFTLAPDLDSLDNIHCVIGEVTEGHEVLRKLNDVICDESHRPYRDVRITHTVVLEDPFNDPSGLRAPSRSPSPSTERLKGGRIAPDEEIDETLGKSAAEIQEMIEEKEAKARATILEIVGDLPDADIAPPENVLFVCKLNPVTSDDDLEIIFSRFGKIVSCEVIRDKKTGDSLQYAFIEFADKKSCEEAYFKMGNVLIDDRRIHVDFSQSVSKMRWLGKGRGVKYFNEENNSNKKNSDSYRPRSSPSKEVLRDQNSERNDRNKTYNNVENRSTHKKDKLADSPRARDNDKAKSNKPREKERNNRSSSRETESRSRNNDKSNNHRVRKERSSDRHTESKSQNRQEERSRNRDERNDNKKSKELHSKSKNRNEERHKDHRDEKKNNKILTQNKNNRNSCGEKDDRLREKKERMKDHRDANERDMNYVNEKNGGRREETNLDRKKHLETGKPSRDKNKDGERYNVNEEEVNERYRSSKEDNHIDRKEIDNISRDRTKDKGYKETSKDDRKSDTKKRKHDEDVESRKTKKSKHSSGKVKPRTHSPSEKNTKRNSKTNVKESEKRKKLSKKRRKQSTSSDSSTESSSSSDSSSSGDSDHKKKARRRRKKAYSSSSSSSSGSSSSSSSSSSSESSSSTSSSSDSDYKKKRRKVTNKKKKKL